MLPRNWKILLTAALSLSLLSCAGKPPKMERPVKFYSGSPARQAMCRRTQAAMTKYVLSLAQHENTKKYAKSVLAQVMAADADECIHADEKEFASLLGLTAADMGVLLKYQEDLLYKCEKWKQ